MTDKKNYMKYIEIIFDVTYLVSAILIGLHLLSNASRSADYLAGIMALTLAFGDSFHLIPRIILIITGNRQGLMVSLGRGKQITSVTMTIFYVMLWHTGLFQSPSTISPVWTVIIYGLAILRIMLCMIPNNGWCREKPSYEWGIYRNIPFLILGIATALLYSCTLVDASRFHWMWLAILISFACYLPVVLWSERNARIGMLMLPKSCAYLWILSMFL